MSRAMLGITVEVTRESAALSQMPSEMSASVAAFPARKRSRQEASCIVSGFPDPIGATARADENMRQSLDADASAENTLEQRQFLAAEPGADARRSANRTVIFDKQQVAGFRITPDFRHVTLAVADARKRLEPRLQRAFGFHLGAIGLLLRRGPQFQDPVEPPLAEHFAHLKDEVGRERRMGVGKARVGST